MSCIKHRKACWPLCKQCRPVMTSLCGADGAQETGNADADGDSIVFLYKVKAGACPKSYGLQVRSLPSFHRQPCYKHRTCR